MLKPKEEPFFSNVHILETQAGGCGMLSAVVTMLAVFLDLARSVLVLFVLKAAHALAVATLSHLLKMMATLSHLLQLLLLELEG
jgi:hypothetical protein